MRWWRATPGSSPGCRRRIGRHRRPDPPVEVTLRAQRRVRDRRRRRTPRCRRSIGRAGAAVLAQLVTIASGTARPTRWSGRRQLRLDEGTAREAARRHPARGRAGQPEPARGRLRGAAARRSGPRPGAGRAGRAHRVPARRRAGHPDRAAVRRPRRDFAGRRLRRRPRCPARSAAATPRCRSASRTASCWSRWPTRPTSSPIDDIRSLTGMDVKPVVATRADVAAAIDRYYRADSDLDDLTSVLDAARGGRRPLQGQGDRRGRADRQVRQPADHPGDPGPRLGHPPRADRARPAGAVPHRRRAARGHALAEGDPVRRHQPAEDHGRHQHRRAADPAGRPPVGQRATARRSTCASRPCRRCGARRSSCESWTTRRRASTCPTSGSREDNYERYSQQLHQALRDDPGHRADRLGQVDDAVRDAEHRQPARGQRHHGRGPGRVPARRASTRCRPTTRPA